MDTTMHESGVAREGSGEIFRATKGRSGFGRVSARFFMRVDWCPWEAIRSRVDVVELHGSGGAPPGDLDLLPVAGVVFFVLGDQAG